MKYSLLFYETAEEVGRRESESAGEYWGAWSAYIDLLANEGVMVLGAGVGLHPPTTATTVRIENGKSLVQDGPVADSKEQLGGIVVLDVPTLDDAMKWASKAPCVSAGAVEIRPVLPDPEG